MAEHARKKIDCAYCGAAPASHGLLYFDTAISIFFDKTLRNGLKPFVILLTPFVRWLTNEGTCAFFWFSGIFGWAVFHDDALSKDDTRKSVMLEDAKKHGIRMQVITFWGKEVQYARAMLPYARGSKKMRWHYFEHIPIPPWLETPLTQNLDNKLELKLLFEHHGIRVPRGRASLLLSTAQEAFRAYAPVIVKPLEGSRARHTRVNVTTEEELEAAFEKAREICPVAMVEEFVTGDIHRATCIGGRLIAVMRFVRPVIEADGVSTLDELREQYNRKTSMAHVAPIADNALFALTARHQGLNTNEVPKKGTVVRLAEFSERTNGGYNEDVTDNIPEATRAYIEKAARTTALAVVGFDIVSADIKNADEPATFLEANTAPFIEIHHVPTVGLPRNVAGAVWDLWFTGTRA